VKENAKATGCRRIRPKRRPWAARGRDAGCDTRMQRLATGTVCGFLKPEHHFGQRNFLQEPTVPRCCVSRHEQKRRNSGQQTWDFIPGEGVIATICVWRELPDRPVRLPDLRIKRRGKGLVQIPDVWAK